MTGLAQKEVNRLLTHVRNQGVETRTTKSGWLLKLPDGGQTVIHKTDSDHRSAANIRARLKQAGISWPDEQTVGDGTPAYIAKGTMRPETLAQFRKLLPDPLPPTVSVIDMAAAYGKPDFKQIYRALYRLGYRQTHGKGTGKGIWALSTGEIEEIQKAPILRAVEQDAQDFPEITKAIAAALPDREFIDTVDSWVLEDLSSLKVIPVGALEALFKSTGLEFEIRVWRKPLHG